MRLNRLYPVALAGVIAAGLFATAAAQVSLPDVASMSVEQIIALRIETMRSNGSTLRGANALSGEAAIAAGRQALANATLLKLLFPEGANTGESNALANIWTDWDNFIAILDKYETDARAMIAAAEAGDNAAYLAALQAVGGDCGTCHTTYRAPL
ncbi:MAG: cytochrome c [Cucumibacter sp.]